MFFRRYYCTRSNFIKNPSLPALKRGTGGRSSFNGLVATVFGASGFLGKYVCNRLGKIGTQLILPYRGDAYDLRPLKLVGDLGQVVFQHFNLKDEESIVECIKYSNIVINLIGRDWETKNYSFDDVHVEGACQIARLAKENGVETLIHVSALNGAENPEEYMLKGGSRFLASKWKGERAVLQEFPDAVVLRPSDMYGQEDRFLRHYMSLFRHSFKLMPLYKKGECTEKQPVYVSDVAAGIVQCCKARIFRGEIIQAIGPNRYLLSDLVDWFHELVRKDDNYGYQRVDARFDPFFLAKCFVLPRLTLGWPVGSLHWEQIEKEIHSDKVDPSLKTLEDLGVKLTFMEHQVPWELRPHVHNADLDDDINDYPEPEFPPIICKEES